MIVTLCGAYRNAGDHLIGARARALLRTHVDSDITNVDRKAITADSYEMFNRARVVLLTGGPAYQRSIYPGVYSLELDSISTAVVPYGLGWKARLGKSVEDFQFTTASEEFVRRLHAGVPLSSARDPLTQELLRKLGIDNVLMTGCPAWYDLSYIDVDYSFDGDTKLLVFSMPAVLQPGVLGLLDWLTRRFKRSRRILSFHHGVIPAHTKRGARTALDFVQVAARAVLLGWRVASLAGSLEKMESLYGSADLHVGYRVHAHLLSLSRRVASILINEDARGVGQSLALGSTPISTGSGNIEPVQSAIEAHFETRGQSVETSVNRMRQTYPRMVEFLTTL